MEDIFNNKILCSHCSTQTVDSAIVKDGFSLRIKECPKCKRVIYHPLDFKEYEDFNKLKCKNFQVKLRFVGNSYAVSIPKEIITFHEEFNKEVDKLIKMTLEEPEKLSLFFSKKIRRF